jgi:3-hydroxyacyl-[acyl-carrier-protein] dehydratase
MSTAPLIDIRQIMTMIPHRYPFLLVDKVVECEPNKSAHSIKNVTINEEFFNGHFPGAPVMPGVLIIEAMAQTAAIMVVHSQGLQGKGKLVYFMTIESAKFRKPVMPGDTLHVHIKTVKNRGAVWKFRGEAMVEGGLVAEAEFSAMIVDPPEQA